jgi:hypothetical protein
MRLLFKAALFRFFFSYILMVDAQVEDDGHWIPQDPAETGRKSSEKI